MDPLRMKNLLLACTVMLALQFCFPLVVRAGSSTQVAEMISLGVKDAESKVDTSLGVEVPTLHLITLFQDEHSVVLTDHFLPEPELPCDPVPPTAGLFPSAP